MKKVYGLVFLWILLILAAGCGLSQHPAQASSTPTVQHETAAAVPPPKDVLVENADTPRALFANTAATLCVHPAGWRAYHVQDQETATLIAARFGAAVEELLQGNCLSSAAEIFPNIVIYVPFVQAVERVETVLPLGISSFSVDPPVVQPGGTVRLIWQGQGAAISARIGEVFNGYFYEALNELPSTGILELTVPDDGREYITYMVRVRGGGEQEVAAQSTVRVMCRESWFFAPAPPGCPSAPLVTTFQEQQFERGTIVYVPALGLHYVMVAGQEAVTAADNFVPGTPLRNANLNIPPGYFPSEEAIFTLWNNENVKTTLGYAISDTKTYPGMMQRSVSPSGELVYFSASSGHVYRIGNGLVWGVIIPG